MTDLTDVQIALVRESYAMALRRPHGFAEIFYHRLFHDHPFVRALFGDAIERQALALTATLSVIVAGIDDLPALLPRVCELARRHVGYGVRAQHYPIVGDALIDTFARILGDRFTPEARAAWVAAYGLLAATMIAAAYPADQAGTDSRAG